MAILIYLLRVVVKISLIALVESDRSKMFDIQEQFRRHMRIMYYGDQGCANPAHVIPVFKISAVLQWALLYALSFCF